MHICKYVYINLTYLPVYMHTYNIYKYVYSLLQLIYMHASVMYIYADDVYICIHIHICIITREKKLRRN